MHPNRLRFRRSWRSGNRRRFGHGCDFNFLSALAHFGCFSNRCRGFSRNGFRLRQSFWRGRLFAVGFCVVLRKFFHGNFWRQLGRGYLMTLGLVCGCSVAGFESILFLVGRKTKALAAGLGRNILFD